MSADPPMRQCKLEEFYVQVKPGKSEANLLPMIESVIGINTISSETVALLLKGQLSIEKFVILDCRFDYEYEGGHIISAKNAFSKEVILEILKENEWENVPIIVHCEFSQLRGPSMIKWLRNHDRSQNIENYPGLSYPELYLMQGGYSEFFSFYPELCQPAGYVPCNVKKSKKELFKIKKSRTLYF